MTGGTVVVLGRTGSNFAAGMTGGRAFVLDINENFERRCNLEQVAVSRINTDETSAERLLLMSLIKAHVTHTGSEWGQRILDNFEHFMFKFRVVEPKQENVEVSVAPVSLKVVG
jgi:glutamate synthase (NADPH/NADH) large chain